MKKIIILTAFLVLVTFPAIAISVEEGGITTVEGIFDVIGKVTNYFFTALIVLAVIFIILAGFTFLTASGDPVKLSKAKNQLLWALVAVAIGALSRGLVEIVKGLMGVVSK